MNLTLEESPFKLIITDLSKANNSTIVDKQTLNNLLNQICLYCIRKELMLCSVIRIRSITNYCSKFTPEDLAIFTAVEFAENN